MRSSTQPKNFHLKDSFKGPKNDLNMDYGYQLQKSKLQDKQKQKVIQDQNYSNNIMMMTLSTLESLENSLKNNKNRFQDKRYGYYDKVNYQNKSYSELKSQLQTHLTLLKASRQVFSQENSKDSYTFPHSFNEQKIKSQIRNFKQVFKGDRQIYNMCQDFQKINQGEFASKKSFQTKNYRPEYSQHQSNANKKDILKRGISAAKYMDNQKIQIQSLKISNQKDLPIYIRNQYQNSLNKPTRLW